MFVGRGAADRALEQNSAPNIAAQRKAEILAAAARCLADLGYDRVRLRDISRESGLSIGLIQHYFESRNAVLEQAFEAVSEALIVRWAEAVEREQPDPWGRIAGLIRQLAFSADLRRQCATWSQFCVVAYREVSLQEGVIRISSAWRAHLEAAIRDGIRAGRFRLALPLDSVLDALLAIVDGVELNVAAGTMPNDGSRFLELVLNTAAVLLGVEEIDTEP